jgi:hypothetical protein
MKKRLHFYEVKDSSLCHKFVYSLKLGDDLKKLNIFHEIWYKGK